MSLNVEGAGKAGCPLHPQPSARKMKAHQHSHHRFNRISPAFPARVVLTVSFVLSPVTWPFCHRRRRDAKHRRQLDTCLGVSGPHDFAVRLKLIRLLSQDVHRIPRPTFRDDGEAPLLSGAGRGDMPLIWGFEQRRRPAADWHDGQIAHNAHAHIARRASSILAASARSGSEPVPPFFSRMVGCIGEVAREPVGDLRPGGL